MPPPPVSANVMVTWGGAAVPDAASRAALIPDFAVEIVVVRIVGELHALLCGHPMAGIAAVELVSGTVLVDLARERRRARCP